MIRCFISTREKSGHSGEVVGNDDDILGDNDIQDDEEYTFLHTDNSDKTRKSFRRVSVDAIDKPFNIDAFNVSTSMSFSEHQFKHTDKEIHMVSNPKYLVFELKVISVLAVFTLIS